MIAHAPAGQNTVTPTPVWIHQLPPVDNVTEGVEAALDRMDARINAHAAHRESLNRAAQGVRTISGQLALLHATRSNSPYFTEMECLAASAIQTAQRKVDSVLAADGAMSVDGQRAHLRAALSQARNALFLLSEHEAAGR